jgi:hypothetical protein
LKQRISSLTPVSLGEGAFENRVNEEDIHSKLQIGEWLEFDAIACRTKAI